MLNSQNTLVKSIKLKLADSLASYNYYSCLNDGSTDSSVTEEEVIFILFSKEGVPTPKYLSIEPVKIADTPRIVQSIEDIFERIGNKSFTDKLVGLNVDGAIMSTWENIEEYVNEYRKKPLGCS